MYAYILTIYVLDMQQLEYVCAQHHDNIYIKCIAEILGMYIRYEMTKSSYRYIDCALSMPMMAHSTRFEIYNCVLLCKLNNNKFFLKKKGTAELRLKSLQLRIWCLILRGLSGMDYN